MDNNSNVIAVKDLHIMNYLARAPIIYPHVAEEICNECKGDWGQFVDIDTTSMVIPMNPRKQRKQKSWVPKCQTIDEMNIPISEENSEPWYDTVSKISICSSPILFIGKLILSMFSTIEKDNIHPPQIMNIEEPLPQ